MKEMYREEVMETLAHDDAVHMSHEELVDTLQEIYIHGLTVLDDAPYNRWTDEELEEEFWERYDFSIRIVDSKEMPNKEI